MTVIMNAYLRTLTRVLVVTPDAKSLTSRRTLDVLSVRSVVKLSTVATRADRRLRELVRGRQPVHYRHKS